MRQTWHFCNEITQNPTISLFSIQMWQLCAVFNSNCRLFFFRAQTNIFPPIIIAWSWTNWINSSICCLDLIVSTSYLRTHTIQSLPCHGVSIFINWVPNYTNLFVICFNKCFNIVKIGIFLWIYYRNVGFFLYFRSHTTLISKTSNPPCFVLRSRWRGTKKSGFTS